MQFTYWQAAQEDRCASRRKAQIDVFSTDGNGDINIFRICDISTSGFSATCGTNLALKARVLITFPGIGAKSATMVWQMGNTAGFAFEKLLEHYQIDEILL